MKAFIEMTKEELAATKIELDHKYNEFKQQRSCSLLGKISFICQMVWKSSCSWNDTGFNL